MRSRIRIRRLATLVTVLALGAVPGAAMAAMPTIVRLPEATHATPIGVGPDGAPWFRVTHGTAWPGRPGRPGRPGSNIGTLVGGGRFVEYPLPLVRRLITDPAGGFWGVEATQIGKSRPLSIARVDGSRGVVKTYPVGTTRGRHGSTIPLIARTDGAVWFLRDRLAGGWSVERLSTADGRVKSFPLRRGCRSDGLAVAADGSAWFTETCHRHGQRERGSAIGRIAPDEGIRRWTLPGRADPSVVTIGKQGTIWFAMGRGFKAPEIGRVTAAGDIAEFPIGPGYLPSLAVGSDGRLWFATSAGKGPRAAYLQSIGPDGRISAPICAEPGCTLEPTGIVAAPNGSLWYGLTAPNLNTGGGGAGLGIDMEIANEAGRIGHLRP